MSVGQICSRDVDTIARSDSTWQAAERMHQRTVGTLVVMNASRQPIGIVTDRDLAIRVLAAGKDPQETTVDQIMSDSPETISDDATIETALVLMRNGRFRRLLVVDRTGKLTGVLSLDDVLLRFAADFTLIGQLLERETPRAAAVS